MRSNHLCNAEAAPVTRRGFFLFLLTLLVIVANAHEFWLQADRFFLRTGERLQVKFMVGENFMGEPWNLNVHRIESLDVWEAGSSASLKDSVDVASGILTTTFTRAGTKLITLQSNAAFIELTSDAFNGYLQEDGLDDVYAHREKTGSLGTKAREHYSRTYQAVRAGW